ncbi:TPA: hyperosmolarity resistance protein Ebh, partial [Staphylococcus aureus]|nr:hyperosmolarity resistance protein Ebh [Staphylococcus aureus]
MNYRDKIQKFSIRKYTVGTFSTVIATLVFLGFNTSQAHAAETNQPASVVKQKQQSNNEQTENRESQVQNSQNSQNGQSLSATHENEQPNINQTNHVDVSAEQSSTTENEQAVSQNKQTKKDTADATPTQSAKAESKHEQNESRSANKKENDNKAAHVENHEANVVTASDSPDNGNVQHDRNELQAFFDANYHDYRFIDHENADSGTFNYVKGIFDKINTLLGSNDPINNKDLQLAYKELEQAVALIRTMPQRQQTSRRSSRIQTRSVESRAAEPRSVSSYQNADSSYYVENANDGSGYPVGTYINASNKGAPFYLPTAPWNTLKASAAKEIVLITAKQTGDGYQWVIKFNKGHAPHENMIFWFALPSDQVPVGRTDFVTVNADGTNVQWSNGAGAGAYKPLPQMWPYGVNDSRSRDFKIRNRSGQVIYDWTDVHVNTLRDLARAGDYFSEAGAPAATKAIGEQTFRYINGERPTESPGASKVYTFIGAGDASYTISFKTQGPTTNKLYYAAGGRALEYNQLFMYSQLYVESTQDHQQRLDGFRQVVNRSYRLGTTKRVEVSQGNIQTKKVLESTNLNIDDFMDDPLSYVKTPSNKVLGFYPTNANPNAYRHGGTNPLNEYQLSQLFTDDKLQQAARTGNPIRLMIGFDYPDGHGNAETLVPVNLTVLPEIQHNIKFYKNDDTQNIADKPASRQAGHPIFYVYAGNQGNASVNLGGSVTSIQPLRINLTSSENFTDRDWQITGIPRTLHIENSTNRPNNARERNIELVGNLLPGDYFGTIRFGRKEQLFEIRVKPHTPTITTTAEQLRGTALQKVPITVTNIPLDPSSLVYIVYPTDQTRDGGSEADQMPSNYSILATGTPDGVHNTITIQPKDYTVFIPPVGKQIRALIYYNKVVASNMSNAVTILPDDIPPTINNPVGLNAKYYRGDEVNFTMGVSDRHSGIKNTTITTLPNGWTSNLTKADKNNGSLSITGRVSMNQAFNSDITFKVSATDNVNNTTNDSQSKHVTVHVGKISEDAHPIVLANSEKVVVVNPTSVSNDEKQRIITAFMNKNQNIRGYLASSNPVTVDNNGNVTLHYRDGSSTTLDATNVMTYEPVVKPEYQTANAPKTATVTIAKGQSFSIGDIKQYFTLSNGQAIPNGTFTNITSDRTIPTAQEVSQMNAGTQLYHIVASNAYHKDTEDLYISLKIIDVKQPEGDQRVYRTSTYDLTTDEISKVKQAFINANRDAITFAEGDISVTNTPNGANVSTVTVNINKGRLTKSFTSNLANMNFLRWVNFPQDYTVSWTNAKIASRPTDGGLSWSDDHKSLIYRYDATLGTPITTNDILTMLKATTTVPGLRNNIAGNEKTQAEAGGRPNYRPTGYSQANASSDGQRQYTLNGQVIQVLDIINPTNGFGGQTITNSNVRANHSNSTVVSVNEPAANGAGAFTIDHVVKNNTTHNAADAVYKAQLYLSPYGPKQYVEHLNQNTGNTTDAINIYFVPSDLVNPTISVGNYANHQVFSGETFTNTITANDNFGVQSVTVPNTSQITGTVDNNHQHVSATAPNVTSATNKTINLVATDTSGNTATTSYNVTIKPLRDKYRVGTSSTAANPVRIANISNNAIVSQADQTAIINSLTFTETVPNRSYARASANEITSKTVSNVSRTGNNANVTVTVTYQDGTTSTVTVPVKHVIPEIVAHSHYTVQGQDFPAGNGSSASDYFKLSNGSAIPDATITWVSGQAPNKDNTRIGEDITVTAHILIDGETTPITKTATYKVVRTVPKHVFETDRGVLYPGVSDMYDAKQYVKPVNNSWSTNAQNMNFQFVGTYGPNKDVVGISTRLIRITYDNRQTEELTILSKVKPDPPRIDGNSVTYKAGLTNQEVKVNNVLSNSTVKLFKADNTPLNVTNIIHGSGYSSVVTVSDALPNGGIKAKSSISMNNVTYTTQDEHGQVVTVTRNESVDSNDSASVTVTPQLQATTEGAVFIKGGDGFDFGHVERFIQNPPHGATVAWHDNPDTWKNTVGNTHKTAVVTLPSGQGTRNVEVPVKVYPVANAKALSRDVKGQNLTNGTDAMSYITFDPNTNTNGITAAWANRQQPNNQQAGVQHLNVDVTYPGISAAKRVPVTVNVYQFEFPQTTYTTTVGGTLASGTQASGYAHMQNATGLPTDGFTYKWNNAATGTNDANWAAMNKPNAAKVVNAKYDVIYNGHTFATSLPAKFVVKDVQPAKPTVTETAAGAITIAPGANQTVNTHAGNVTTYADKLVIKRNGSVVTTFTRHNNTSPWVKEASATNVTGIVGTNNGITVAAGTFNPADTIQVVATQGSGETISDEQRSDDFTVVAPQPNQATTKIWQNGHIDITPNNPSGHLINPTQAMDIAYTEKVGNGAEHSKTINVVRGQNNQWTIANKPDYVTLDAQTGKVTFNANTIKPNSAITITPKAGTGHSASSNPSTLTAPAAHTVNTTEIVKDYGSNVTASEINNAVQVANKRTATIKNGTAMPTNLAGGSTTTIPVTVTYNDGSTEEVQESIFTKADKRELITAKNHLDDPVSTDGKKPGTITQYNNAMHNAQQQINAAKTEAQQVINNERATPQQVNAALSKVQAAQTKINEAKALLQNKEDNSQLVTSKNNLQSSVNQVPSTAGMTQQSIDNYNAKKREAESEITAAQRIIDNGDATAQQISDEKHRVDNALTALNQAKHDLTADTHALEQAVQQLNRTGTTTGKKPASITAYNNSIRALQSDLTSAKNSANAIIQKPIRTVQEVQSALTNVNRVNERLTQAINQLVPLADNSTLRTAKTKLDEEINKSVTTDGMTQSSIQAYENAKRAGQTESTNAQNVINNGDATDQQIAAEKAKVEEKYNSLKQAIAGLTPDLAPLQTAKTQLQNDIDQPTSTTGMTSASVATFNEKLSAARTKIQEINRVLASHPDVATIRQNVTAANAAKSALDQARNGLTVDKAPLENAKNQLQHRIDTQTSTTGMTQDSINAYNAKLTAARNKIQQINQVLAGSPTVDQINTNTSAANQAKSDLDHARQALTPDKTPLQNAKTQLEQSINQPTDTTGMTTASLNAYNQKLQAARQKLTEINQVLNGNPTVQNINDKVAEANQAKDQLNTARQGLTLDRQPALTTLHGASNLNQAQQNNFTQQINAAQNHAALETIKSNITALNTAMTKLKESVADNNSIKSGQNYTDATQANKQAYDNAVNAAKGVIGETNNPTMDVNTVNQKAASVKSTKDALDGQQNLQRAKTEATNAITHASDLNQAQKNALTQQVNSAQNVQAVNNIKQTTQSLNTAMTGLKRGVANHNQVVQSDNYVNADTNKKNDYNNAYNHANDIINGNPQHPVITPSDVNNALSNVTSKEHALNGEAKLNTAKQEANTALGQLNNLNNAQRQNLQSQINGAHQIETVNTIKQNATNLNSAMGNLRHAVADKEQVKRTEDYADADTAKQNAYNTAVTSAENIINATSQPTLDPSAVTQAANQVNTNKTALNGVQNLANKKQETTANINQLSHLNNAQKQDLNTQVTNAPNISTVNQVKTKAEQLDQAMERLINGIQDKDQVKQSVNFTDADPEKQTAYNNAVTAAENIINQANGTNANQSQVEAALSTVTTTKQALNGNRKVTDAKNNANQTLSTLDNLNNAQKGAVTGNINQAHTVAEVTQAIQTAQELNTAMGNLKNSLNDKDTTLGSQNFADADPEKKNAYNEAVHNAENILNKSTGTNVPKDQVEAAMNQVNTTKAALNGTQNLEKAKQHANTAIDGLSHLTNAQKDALKQLVQQSTTVAEAQGNEQKANNVDAAMDKLRQSIADNATTKQNQNYTDASPNKKDAYNNAVTTAQGIIDQTTSPTLDPTVINQAAGQVSTTKNALNGNENLEAAKQQATQSLGSLDNLNNAQKQTVTDQINGAHTVDEANQIKQNAQNLNTAMGNLKQAIADKDATKATVNFTDADQAKQQAYNTAVTNAENIISKANGGNATQTEVEQAIQQVNAAKQALNGNANVQHAKDEATALINSSNDLNQAQKDALKQQVQNATTVAGVNNVKQTAQELNNAMTQLKQGIADKEQTKADGNFVNADPDKQNAYNQAVAKAEALISGTPDVVVTPSEITAALNKVTQAKNDLNGNTNLATAKQNVQQAIDQLPNLNQAQRDEYNKQITQATLVPNVNAIQQAATTLNDAMTQLKQGIANKAQIKGSENYHDADTDKQTAYDNAVTKAEELLKQTTNPTMDPNTIQQALTKVNDTNQALNGNQKLADAKQAAKTNLGTLDHLNDAQKQALTTQVEQAPDIATVNNVKQNAQNLNNAMTNLNNALQDKTETLNSINFTDADQAKKDAYTNAVAHAEGILSKANGSNASQTEVEQAIQRVNEAKQALNGNDNVQRAKDAAKQVITNANDLNQAQKDALKQQVDAAQTVANVNTIKQTAQDLNQAMTQLKQGIADKDQTKANGNFVNADTDKQNAYNNAVAHAEQIISGTPNANVDPQQVAQALQQVTQAKGDLNGNHNLQVAKDNANTAIDQLPNLNQPQKTALKDQVSHAELVTGVNAIKQNADALNNAMGTLKQQIQANSQVPQSVDFTQADQDKQQAYNNAANQAQQIANGTPTPVLSPDTVTQAVTTMNQAKDALNGDEKLAQAKQDALANLDTLRDLNQPQRDALRNQINQAQALATVEQTKQNAQNVNATMGNLKQGIANKDTVKASENYHDADADKQTAYTNAVSQAEGIINQTTNPTLNPDEITRALTQVTDAKNGLNGEAKLATEKQNAKDAVSGMTHLNDAQKQALKGQIDQSPEIATVNQVKQTATSLDHAMDQLSQAINDKAQTLADGNYLNADPDKQNAYKQAVAKAEALLNKQSGTNEVQAQVESITNEVKTAKQALNGNDNLANAKQQAKQQLANLTHLNDAQKQSFENQITQAPLVTDVTTINQKAQTLDHAMELLRNSIADNQATLASEDYHDATAQRQNDYNQAVTAANNIINQTTSPTMNPDDVNRATTQVNNTKVALDGDENLVAAKQQANNRLDQLDHLNNAQKQQLQSQITQSSDIAAVNGHKQTAESLNTAMGNLINAIADHQAVEQRGNFINADTDKQTAYTTAVNEAEAMINKQTGQNANQTEVEQAITKVQTTLQALNGDHNLQVAKTNATQAIDALTSLNDPQKTALKDQVTAATLVTAVHQIEQTANTLNQAMHGLRESIQDNATTQANSKYINEDQPEQQNYDQAVQAANNIINEQTATLDNNAINQAATTVNTTKAALHGDVKLQNDKDRAKQTVSQLAHLNNAQKHMEDTLIDSETTRTAVNHDLTEAQALDQLMDTLQQSIADKDATRASSAYVNAEPNKKQAYDEAVQNAESIIAGLTNPTINKGNVSSATQAVTSSKNALDGVERLAQDKQTAGNSLNHLDQLTPAQQQALENQINNATTRDKVAEIIAQAQALNEAMKALKESIKDQPQTEASSKFINEDQAQKDAYTQAVQHAKDLINKTTDPTLAKSIIDQATQAVTDAKNNLHGDQKLAQDKQRATETLNNLSNLNTPQRQALENQINNAATRDEVAQKLTEAQALNQAMEALRNSIQDQQQTEAGSKFINEDKPQKDAYQAAVQHAKDLINQTSNPTLDKAQVEQLTQAVNQAKDNLHGDQKLADDKQHAVTDLNQLNGLNNPQRQALESQINNAATRGEVAQKLTEAQALNQAMEALRNSIQDQQQTESGSKFINEDKPQKDAYQAAVQNAKDLINQTGNPTLDKSQVEQLTQAVTTAKDNLHGDQKLARDQQQAVTTVNALPNLNHAQQQALTDAINAAPTRTEVAQHVQTATELDHAMETLKNKVDQVKTDKAQPNYTEASTDKKEAVDQALQAAQSITEPNNGSNANKDAVEQALTKLQEKENELNGNERVAEAKTQAKQTVDQLTHLNADQIATAKQNIDQAMKLQPIAELVDQATQLNKSMDQLQQAVNDHTNVEQTVDYTQADSDKQNAYKQAIADAENVLKQNANKEQVDQALQNILNAKQALNGDERVALAKTNGKHDIDQLNTLNNAQQDGFKGRIDQSNDLNEIKQIVDEAKALNRAMNQLSQEITGNEGRTKGSTNYVNADTQVKRVYDDAVDKAKEALNKATGQNLTAEEVIKLNDAVTAAKQALNGEERLNKRKSEALQRLDQLTHLNNAQRQLATQQINNAETLNKASRAINRAVQLDDAMGAVQQYIDDHHFDVISSTNYINADDNLKANYDNAITNAAHELDKVQGSAITKAEAEQLKQNIIDAQQALNGDQNLATAKDKANAFVDTLNGLNQQQQDLAHQAINNADTVTGIANIINDQIDLNNAMETLKHLVDNEIPTAEQTINYQNADDVAKSIFDDAKRLANTLLNSDNTNVNDINGAIQAVNDAIQNLNGDQRLQEAKDKAIQNVNKVLADKLKEIEASNATDQDKLIAKNKAEELANSIINNINKATSNQDVSQVQTAGNHAIEQVHANEIPKAKIDANKDADKQVQALIDEIDRNPNLTDKEKQA